MLSHLKIDRFLLILVTQTDTTFSLFLFFESFPKEEVRPLWFSKRVISHEELPTIARHIGANWKAVGIKLGFISAKLDQFEADTRTMVHAVQRMLYRWIQWKYTKATVGKLTIALFEHREYDAIRILQP